ncbi:MAG: hypothetical protein WBR18_11975 [Anaerolineales bacterium]
MSATNPDQPVDLRKVIESANRMGVELDEEQALEWLKAISQGAGQDDIVFDEDQGVFGHRVTMLDFSPVELARFRRIGDIVQFSDVPGEIETALALSGSAAQSKIQAYPGDCDFFERVNIHAPTRAEACLKLAGIIRDKALSTRQGPTYQLMEVKFGSYPENLIVNDMPVQADSPVSWDADQLEAGYIETTRPDGEAFHLTWEDAANDPGWCKLDWVVADSLRGELSAASNMLDVTWEAPDGSITPLDGYLDPYFQEVYLEAESIPIFTKLAKHVSADALDEYVEQLEHEVKKYLTEHPNYGKAAKRMYNVFRLKGRYEEAIFIRELFDEPASLLYQVWALIRTIDEAAGPGSSIPRQTLIDEADQLVLSVADVLEGEQEQEILRLLLRLRDRLSDPDAGPGSSPVNAARSEVINLVNNFFYDRLTGLPAIREYMDNISTAAE